MPVPDGCDNDRHVRAPLIEGGHLVLARSLERALQDAGHHAGIVTTPSNRFGRQGTAYLANWLTDVGVTGSGERVDQIVSMRYPSYAVRIRSTCAGSSTRCAKCTDLWDRFAAGLSPQGRLKERMAAHARGAADTLPSSITSRRCSRFPAPSAIIARWNGVPPTCCIRHAGATIAATSTATTCSRIPVDALKRTGPRAAGACAAGGRGARCVMAARARDGTGSCG